MKRTPAMLVPAVIWLCCSCNQSESKQKVGNEARGEILARVGGELITTAEVQSEWDRRHGLPGFQPTAEQRARLVDELVREKAVLAKAKAAGWDRHPETVALIERLIVARYTEGEFARRSAGETQIDEADIDSFYETNSARYQIPAAVRAGFIWLKISSKADQQQRLVLVERANDVWAKAASSDATGFKTLVQQHSEDQATRYTGGDTGWLNEGQPALCDPLVAAAAFQLRRPGEVAPLVVSSNGCYIVRLSERRQASARPLAEVRETIRYELQQQKQRQREQEFFAEMKRGLLIEIDQAILKSISLSNNASKAVPPALPGG